MKRPVLFVLSLWISVAVVAQSAIDVKEIVLRNGLTVWVNEDHAQPKVFGAVVVRAGAKDCPDTGIAHYFEHILFKGTDRIGTVDYARERVWLDSISAQYDLLAQTNDAAGRRAIQQRINELSVKAAEFAIPNEFENLITTYGGTRLNAYTSFDETVYHNYFAPQYLAQWCELNAERLVAPVFRLFQGELETVYEEKNMYADNMLMQALEAAQREGLAGTPYAYPIIGSTESLKTPSLSAMRRFYDQYYVAGNMGLVLCGDVWADSLRPLLEQTFGRIRRGKAPTREASRLRNFRGSREVKVKVPVPIVKGAAYAFKAPMEREADYAPFMVATALLTNSAGTGLLDSLVNTHHLMGVMAQGNDFKDFSVYGFGYVPNLPLGTKRKADRLCWEQIDRLRHGLFTEADLQAEKLALRRKTELALENMGSRSTMMINAMSRGVAWGDVLGRAAMLDRVSREDVVRVARTYFNDDSLKISKTFGRYPKEKLSQPGYRPVSPKHAGEKSEYAKILAKMPYADRPPKLVDMDGAVEHRQLAPLVNLYTVGNPMNDISELRLTYRVGEGADRRMGVLGDYLGRIGTESRTRQQLGRALQRLGGALRVSSGRTSLTLTLSVFDDRLAPALRLLNEFLTRPMANKKAYRQMVKETLLEEKTFFKDNQNIADAVFELAEYGEKSKYLDRSTAKTLRRSSGEELVGLFQTVQQSQLDVVYSGRIATDDLVRMIQTEIPIGRVEKPWSVPRKMLREVAEPVVYVYDNPRARQTMVGSYQCLPAMTGERQRTALGLWGRYFGGGMSSVMFQDIREFRAYAYSSHGWTLMPDRKMQPEAPCGYVTRLGTQADKAMLALGVLDTLLSCMPVREANMMAARQEMISAINDGYPSFRQMGGLVADWKLMGYDDDPRRATAGILPTMGIDDITKFYQKEIQGGKRAWIVVGNRRMMDLEKLKTLGRVVVLTADDIYRR